MNRVVVTGATGFLGSSIARSYLKSGAVVMAAGHRRVFPAASELPIHNLKSIKLDICGPANDLDVFTGYDLVINSAVRHYASTSDDRMSMQKVNVEGTSNIIEACLRNGVPRLLHVSTSAAIGISTDPDNPADESFQYNLRHLDLPYNSTKHLAEQLVLSANGPSLKTVVVNPGFIIGCYGEVYRGGSIFEAALNRYLNICTNGGLSIVYIDDVVDGICRAADNGRAGERYILSGDNITFSDITRTVGDKAGRPVKVLVVPDMVRDLFGIYGGFKAKVGRSTPPLHLSRYAYQFYSSEKARRELGYNPRSFEDIVVDYMRSAVHLNS